MVKRTLFITLLVLGILLFALALFLGSRNRYSSEGLETRGQMIGVAAGIEFYRREYGVLPMGDASAVARVVAAMNGDDQNSKRVQFLAIDPERLRFDKHGTWVDEWGQPVVLIRIDTTNLVLRSYGQNRRDDGGQIDGDQKDDLSIDVNSVVRPASEIGRGVGKANDKPSIPEAWEKARDVK